MTLDRVLSEISQLADARKYAEALQLAASALGDHSYAPELHRKIAYLKAQTKDFEGAIDQMSEAVRLNPDDLGQYFNRARWLLRVGQFDNCADDCTRIIEQESSTGGAYYSGSTRLLRAIARLNASNLGGAKDDLAKAPPDAEVWAMGRVQTVETVSKMCEQVR